MSQSIQGPSVQRLMQAGLRTHIEHCVSAYLGRDWQVQQTIDKTDEASHPAAILSDGAFAVFVKLGKGELAADQFTQEWAGLRVLSERAGVLTPTGIDIVPVEGGSLFIMEAVEVVARADHHWREMGRALAQVHQVKGEHFGLDRHCYWGNLYQDNRPLDTWHDFFWQRRIEPHLRLAVDAGQLPKAIAAKVEKLGSRLAEICGPTVQPTLLHGDAHQNNFLSTPQGQVLIDSSAYYGHPEVELAYIDYFAPVNPTFFDGYQEISAIDPGFAQRRSLWRIPAWLVMLEMEGTMERLNDALRIYV